MFTVIFYGQPYETVQIHENMAENPQAYLLRHKSGRYYARAFAGGKAVWKSFKTSYYSVAEAKLTEFLAEHGERDAPRAQHCSGAARDVYTRCDRASSGDRISCHCIASDAESRRRLAAQA
jgi:hypothetical protein